MDDQPQEPSDTESELELQDTDQISWEASEYVHHEKNPTWFIVFSLIAVAIMGLMYVILEDYLSVVVVGLMAVAVIVFANRRPRTMKYSVSDDGITVGDNRYLYDSFRSFSLMQEGPLQSIILDPTRRFLPPITMYLPPDEEDKIITTISHYLPHETKKPDLVDRFARKIRF